MLRAAFIEEVFGRSGREWARWVGVRFALALGVGAISVTVGVLQVLQMEEPPKAPDSPIKGLPALLEDYPVALSLEVPDFLFSRSGVKLPPALLVELFNSRTMFQYKRQFEVAVAAQRQQDGGDSYAVGVLLYALAKASTGEEGERAYRDSLRILEATSTEILDPFVSAARRRVLGQAPLVTCNDCQDDKKAAQTVPGPLYSSGRYGVDRYIRGTYPDALLEPNLSAQELRGQRRPF